MSSSPEDTTTDTDSATPTGDVDPRVVRSMARVLEAATELLVADGPNHVTVDAVCERSGVAKSTIYRHWPSRTALLVDVIRSNLPPLPAVDPSLGFEGALRAHVSALVASLEDPHWRRIMPALFLLKRQIDELDEISETDTEERMSAFHQVIELGITEGRLPPGIDTTLPVCAVFGPLIYAALDGHIDERAVGQYVIDQFLHAYPPPT